MLKPVETKQVPLGKDSGKILYGNAKMYDIGDAVVMVSHMDANSEGGTPFPGETSHQGKTSAFKLKQFLNVTDPKERAKLLFHRYRDRVPNIHQKISPIETYNADQDSFVVLPQLPEEQRSKVTPFRSQLDKLGIPLGSSAMVFYGGKSRPAIASDVGPDNKAGEGSRKLFQGFGIKHPTDSDIGGLEDPKGAVVYVFFKNSDDVLYQKNSFEKDKKGNSVIGEPEGPPTIHYSTSDVEKIAKDRLKKIMEMSRRRSGN